MVIPIVSRVLFFLDIAIFVVPTNEHIAVVIIVGYHLVQVAMWFFKDGQLGIAAAQSEREYKQGNQHSCVMESAGRVPGC